MIVLMATKMLRIMLLFKMMMMTMMIVMTMAMMMTMTMMTMMTMMMMVMVVVMMMLMMASVPPQVLRRLRYVDSSTVQLKGRVACEISNHELMITELVFENVFTDLHPADIVALLSCFVFQQVSGVGWGDQSYPSRTPAGLSGEGRVTP